MKLQTFLFLILAAAVVLIYVFRDDTVLVEDDSKRVIDSLKTVIETQRQERETLALEIKTLNEDLLEHRTKLQANQEKLNKLKRTYNEKMDSIRHMSHGDIQLYFTNRYQDK